MDGDKGPSAGVAVTSSLWCLSGKHDACVGLYRANLANDRVDLVSCGCACHDKTVHPPVPVDVESGAQVGPTMVESPDWERSKWDRPSSLPLADPSEWAKAERVQREAEASRPDVRGAAWVIWAAGLFPSDAAAQASVGASRLTWEAAWDSALAHERRRQQPAQPPRYVKRDTDCFPKVGTVVKVTKCGHVSKADPNHVGLVGDVLGVNPAGTGFLVVRDADDETGSQLCHLVIAWEELPDGR